MIQVRNLQKRYGQLQVLKDINCDIEKGEVISIIGPSGTGKSTLLRCLNRLERPDGGSIIVDGVDLMKRDSDVRQVRRKMGMVFQSFNLFSHLMIIENLMLGPTTLLGIDRQTAYNESMKLLQQVGIADKGFAYPDELSGGQKQRAAIARCLAMRPEIVLFDEPTSALDPTMVSEVLQVIRKLAQDGMTMMIVTHEMEFAKNVSTRVFYMDEGIIYEDGPSSQIFGSPMREKTRAFIYKIKRFTEHIGARSFDLYHLNARLEQFAAQHFLTEKRLRAIISIVEEMLLSLLLPRISDDNLSIDLTVDQLEGNGSTEITFSYPGPDVHPLEGEDNLAARLVRGRANAVEMSEQNGLNVVKLTLG